MLTLAATETITIQAGTTNVIAATITGMELNAGIESYKVLAQALVTTSNATLYTAPTNTEAFIKSFHLANTSSSDVADVRVFVNGNANANQISQYFSIPANGFAVMEEDGWRIFNNEGELVMRASNSALSSFRYKYSPTTSGGDPGSGYVAFNASPPTSATKMYISKTNANGGAMAALLDILLAGPCVIQLADGAFAQFITVRHASIQGSNTNYYECNITVSQNSHAALNTDQSFYVQFRGSVSIDTQTFTAGAAGNWTKPAGAFLCHLRGWGGGASGGGGARNASSVARGGAGGGSGGSYQERTLPASLLGSTEAYSVANSVTGGAGATVNGNSGSNGSNGNETSFGTGPNFWLRCPGGIGGTGGSASGGARGAFQTAFTAAAPGLAPGGDGGAGDVADGIAANASQPLVGPYRAGPGGGGGGAGNGAASTTSRTGGSGGRSYATATGVATGGSNTSAGNPGANRGDGGGGGGSGSGAGGNGGNGAAPGGGGGGGGAGTAANGGTGGQGAGGEIVVMTLCAA